jgi:hypothetical protein
MTSQTWIHTHLLYIPPQVGAPSPRHGGATIITAGRAEWALFPGVWIRRIRADGNCSSENHSEKRRSVSALLQNAYQGCHSTRCFRRIFLLTATLSRCYSFPASFNELQMATLAPRMHCGEADEKSHDQPPFLLRGEPNHRQMSALPRCPQHDQPLNQQGATSIILLSGMATPSWLSALMQTELLLESSHRSLLLTPTLFPGNSNTLTK